MNKLTSFVKASAALLFAFALSFGLFTNSAFAEFSPACYYPGLDGSVLEAICARADGKTPNKTSIDLNEYIENVDGELKWQPGNFYETCRGFSLEGENILKAECKTRAQYWVPTKIDLDDHITSIDGTLRYEE